MIEITRRAIATTRGRRVDKGRGKAEGVSGRLETTGQLIYSRVQGEGSQVES